MKGDFTRNTFHKDKHFTRVLQQQGRVQLEADWNEQGDIAAFLHETAVRDVVGPSGAPMDGGGFRIEATADGQLVIAPGRIYVHGILCELPGAVVPILPISLPAPPSPQPEPEPSVERAEPMQEPDTLVLRRPAPELQTFTLNVSDADFRRLNIAPGDAVKLLFLDSLNQENEAGPYRVLYMASLLSGGVAVTFSGTMFPFTAAPRLRRETDYLRQPDFPGAAYPSEDGAYLAYLDAWSRHLTYLDDPQIRETALGGPDTATRAKTVCQVRLLPIGGAEETDYTGNPLNCLSKPELWNAETAPGSGRLRARAQPDTAADDPCIVPGHAGFRGLENQLYRIEIHEKGNLSQATFKWSRDNGIVATWWVGVSVAGTIQVADPGRDAVRTFHEKDWVELIEADAEADGRKHGVMVQLGPVEADLLTLAEDITSLPSEVAAWFTAFELARTNHTPPPRIKVRRWDEPKGARSVKAGAADPVDGWIPLEQGVQVRFEPEAGTFKTGDYWTFPARTFGSSGPGIEWPQDAQGNALAVPSYGIEHQYCKLAVVVRTGGAWSVRGDCRALFPPLTGLLHLEKQCGDCQEALPGERLNDPLRLAVLNGGLPMPGKAVRLIVTSGGGSLSDLQGTLPDTSLELTTGLDGAVGCFWTLGARYGDQQVEAWLLDNAGTPAGPGVCFAARQSVPVIVPISGDGQEGRPGEPLASELAVAVRIGSLQPLAGALVRFQILDYIPFDISSFGRLEEIIIAGEAEPEIPSGGGELQELTTRQDSVNLPSPFPIEVWTGADGIARARLYLGKKLLVQRVRVDLVSPALLDEGGVLIDVHTCFTASLRLAREVTYEPGACEHLLGVHTVQEALDRLCQRLPPDPPRFFVEHVTFSNGVQLLNDSRVEFSSFSGGLEILCTADVAAAAIAARSATCFVTVETPFRTGELSEVPLFWSVTVAADVSLKGSTSIELRPTEATADVSLNGSRTDVSLNWTTDVSLNGSRRIEWRPTEAAISWLRRTLFSGYWPQPKDIQPVLARLTLLGNFIWTAGTDGQPLAYLDGDTFGHPSGDGRVDLARFFFSPAEPNIAASAPSPGLESTDRFFLRQAISGDRSVGGPFTMWFWLLPPFVLEIATRVGTVAGRTHTGLGAPVSGVELDLGFGGEALATSNAEGEFGFPGRRLSSGSYPLTAKKDGFFISTLVEVAGWEEGGQDVVFTAEPPTAASAEQDLTKVPGIGPVLRGRLEKAGVSDLTAMAEMKPARFADVLQVSEARAQSLLESARRLVGGKPESTNRSAGKQSGKKVPAKKRKKKQD